ncbi:esterase [Nocardia sp. ET3-3]|uniref:Esterase n=1 Tax=Nocardia terrae TaxID=2675851 RepID=A0A7K1USN9_9NOCA|nr:PHB depolymerase family esterase [Nocardia terrae]MVU77354.1 esterase [Nocardia terrae]
METVHSRVGGRRRSFALRLPATASSQVPLVLVLHGNRSSVFGPIQRLADSRAQRVYGFGACADRHGIAVAYPNARGGAWADGRGVTRSDTQGVDDVAFLRAVAEWCADRYGAGHAGVMVAGISNGAFMAHRMALEASDLVAAIGAIAGGLPAAIADSRPTHAVSALLINGTADRIVPIEGGHSRRRAPDGRPRGRTLSLAETARRWSEFDRCTTAETIEEQPSGPGPDDLAVTRRITTGGVGRTRVEAWTIHGMGHTWPGAPVPAALERALGKSPSNVDAAEALCRFAIPLLEPAEHRRIPD